MDEMLALAFYAILSTYLRLSRKFLFTFPDKPMTQLPFCMQSDITVTVVPPLRTGGKNWSLFCKICVKHGGVPIHLKISSVPKEMLEIRSPEQIW